jgi:biopolymer transport protein ExbD
MLHQTIFRPPGIKKRPSRLSLVALMDIFTILLFFLLLTSGESQKIENARFVDIPSSSKGATPHNQVVISLGKEVIAVDDTIIAQVKDIRANGNKSLKELEVYLQEYKATREQELTAFEKKEGLSITIMGDKETPFELLKQVMWTCRGQDFRNISLAVNRVSSQDLVF